MRFLSTYLITIISVNGKPFLLHRRTGLVRTLTIKARLIILKVEWLDFQFEIWAENLGVVNLSKVLYRYGFRGTVFRATVFDL